MQGLVVVLFLILGLVLIYKYLTIKALSEIRIENVREDIKILEMEEDKFLNPIRNNNKPNIKEKNRTLINNNSLNEKELTKNLLEKLNKKYGTKRIKAFITTGREGINEPITYGVDNFDLKSDVNRRYNTWGHVFLYWKNKDFSDDHLTIFGHNNWDTSQFGRLANYQANKNNLQKARLFIEGKIKHYELVGAYKVNNNWYEKKDTWTKEGMKVFISELEENSYAYQSDLDKLDIDKDKTMILSTCSNRNPEKREIGIYRLVTICNN